MKTSLGNRMKQNYEDISRYKLTRRMPAIIRLDGKAFHSLTRGLNRPYDENFRKCMAITAISLCKQIQNVKLAYCQSDEISLLLIDYTNLDTSQWFDGNIQKMVSVSSSIASVNFSLAFSKKGYFDARTFNIPKEEVCNYFIWRQQDATRNSILGLGQKYFSHKQLHNFSCNRIQDKLFKEEKINWNDIETKWKRGFCIVNNCKEWIEDLEIPIFTQEREYIEKYLIKQGVKNE